MRNGDEALISIKPNYARAILAGTKTVELRRRIPTIRRGTRLWIYATLPLGAIVGSAVVADIIRGTPAAVWKTYRGCAAVSRREFDEYFTGTSRALALVLSDAIKRREIGIDKLRELSHGFHPPQVMARLSRQETAWLSRRARAVA